MRRGRVLGALSAAACAAAALAGPAQAATAPPIAAPAFGHFWTVLAQGEGQTATPADFGAYELNGTVPRTFTDQGPLYAGIMPHAATLTAATLPRFYKDADFGSMPGGVGSVTSPRPGVTIIRDKAYGMAHIWGDDRQKVMWAAGYATAQERLFLMDVLRHTAEGTSAAILGPSAASDDSTQLADQDFSPQELTDQFDSLPQRFGAEGEQAHQDIQSYVDGINAWIDHVRLTPTDMPAEYIALGVQPEPWTVADTAALATMLITQFTISNGGEEVNAALELAFRARYGSRWRDRYRDFREANDPGALVVAKRPFLSDDPGKVKRGLNAIPDANSVKPRDAVVSGAGARSQLPPWAQRLLNLKAAIPHVESNAVMVGPQLSRDGHALAAMGPQVGYYSPQIFSEYELHGGGIDVEGITFPGSSPYPLIGHGIDFAWSGTSANGDNEDTFMEKLCTATTYAYKGKCIPFTSRDLTVHTPGPLNLQSPGQPSQTITYRTLRSVHGPVFAYATVKGRPVALTKAKAVDYHELDAVLSFMRLAENRPTGPRSFQAAMSDFPGSENWFYVDEKHTAWLQGGRYPKHAAHSDLDLPFWGDGRADWQGFDPATYTFDAIPSTHRPQAVDPRDGYLVSWNQKEARGWRKGPREWTGGPIQDALRLKVRLLAETRHGKIDLATLARVVNQAATTDLREEDVYPWMRRAIGRASGEEERMLGLLDSWQRSGSQRLDANGDNVYDHSAAVALMDAWWPLAVRAEFQPQLGKTLFDDLGRVGLSLGSFDSWGWTSDVQKDLRAVTGHRFRGRMHHVYCGDGSPVRCRRALLGALDQAIAAVKAKLGPDPAQWKVHATCPQTHPASCDQLVPNTAGAIDTPPFPWQDRGTFHQVDEVTGHR